MLSAYGDLISKDSSAHALVDFHYRGMACPSYKEKEDAPKGYPLVFLRHCAFPVVVKVVGPVHKSDVDEVGISRASNIWLLSSTE